MREDIRTNGKENELASIKNSENRKNRAGWRGEAKGLVDRSSNVTLSARLKGWSGITKMIVETIWAKTYQNENGGGDGNPPRTMTPLELKKERRNNRQNGL